LISDPARSRQVQAGDGRSADEESGAFRAQDFREALRQQTHDVLAFEKSGERTRELLDDSPVVIAAAVEFPIDEPLHALPQRHEEQGRREDAREGEHALARARDVRDPGPEQVRHQVVHGDEQRREPRVDHAAPQHELQIHESVAQDAVGERERHKNQREEDVALSGNLHRRHDLQNGAVEDRRQDPQRGSGQDPADAAAQQGRGDPLHAGVKRDETRNEDPDEDEPRQRLESKGGARRRHTEQNELDVELHEKRYRDQRRSVDDPQKVRVPLQKARPARKEQEEVQENR
jgi:hypothetical protein